MTQNRFDSIIVDNNTIWFEQNHSGMRDAIKKLPAANLHYRNARPVQILENQIKKILMSRDKQNNTKKLMNDFLNVIKTLKELDQRINFVSIDPTEEKQYLLKKMDDLATSITQFANDNENENAKKIIKDVKLRISYLSEKFKKKIETIDVSRDAMNYLHAAQKRDGAESFLYEDQISTLGTYLNYVSCELVTALAQILPLPEYEDSIAQNFISLSENSQILQKTLEHIQYQRKLAYKRYVNTHTQNQLSLEVPHVEGTSNQTRYRLNINAALENLSPLAICEYLSQLVGQKRSKGKAGWFTAGRLVWDMIGGREEFLEEYEQQKKNILYKFYLNLQGIIIGFLSAIATIFTFAVNFVISTILFAVDIPLGFIALLISPFFGIVQSFSIAHNLSRFQETARNAQVDAFTDNTDEQKKLKDIINLHQKPFNFFEYIANTIKAAWKPKNDPSTPFRTILIQKMRNLFDKIRLMATFSPTDNLTIISRVRESSTKSLQLNTSQDDSTKNTSQDIIYLSLPQGGHSIITARSPTEAPVDILLLLSDELIGPWRARFNWPSSIAAAACITSMGCTLLIPAAVVSKMGFTSIGQYCQYITAHVAKAFMGTEHISDPAHEMFGMILEWKLVNLGVEVIGDIGTGHAETFNYFINYYQYIIPVMTISTILGIELGNLSISTPGAMPPVVKQIVDFWVTITESILQEAKEAQGGVPGLTSIEYSFLIIKLGLLIHSWFETDDKELSEMKEMILEISQILKNNLQDYENNDVQQLYNDILNKLKYKYSSNPQLCQKIEAFSLDEFEKILKNIQNTTHQLTYIENSEASDPMKEFTSQKNDVEQLLSNLSCSLFTTQISNLSLQDRAIFYCEMLDTIHKYNALAYSYGLYPQMINLDTIENLKIRFSNRFILSEYSAIWRLPVLFAYPFMVPIRSIFRKIFYRNQSPIQKAELAQLEAHDKILLNEWPGLLRSSSYQAFGLVGQTIVFLVLIASLPISLFYSAVTQSALGANLKALENTLYSLPTYLLLKSSIFLGLLGVKLENEDLEFALNADLEFGGLGGAIHQGTICTEIEDLAQQIKLQNLSQTDIIKINSSSQCKNIKEEKIKYLQAVKSSKLGQFATNLSSFESQCNSPASNNTQIILSKQIREQKKEPTILNNNSEPEQEEQDCNSNQFIR